MGDLRGGLGEAQRRSCLVNLEEELLSSGALEKGVDALVGSGGAVPQEPVPLAGSVRVPCGARS